MASQEPSPSPAVTEHRCARSRVSAGRVLVLGEFLGAQCGGDEAGEGSGTAQRERQAASVLFGRKCSWFG